MSKIPHESAYRQRALLHKMWENILFTGLNTWTHERHRVVCPECGKNCLDKYALKMHISLHTAEKNFKCRELCEETFRTCQFRLLHKRSCRGVKEFKCKICPKEFMQCVSLKFQMGNHGGRKDNKCRTCGAAYVDPRRARTCKHKCKHLITQMVTCSLTSIGNPTCPAPLPCYYLTYPV